MGSDSSTALVVAAAFALMAGAIISLALACWARPDGRVMLWLGRGSGLGPDRAQNRRPGRFSRRRASTGQARPDPVAPVVSASVKPTGEDEPNDPSDLADALEADAVLQDPAEHRIDGTAEASSAPASDAPRRPRESLVEAGAAPGQAAFLFEGGRLVDANAAARRLLRGLDRRPGDLRAVAGLLSRRFGADLGERVAQLAEGERLCLAALGGEGAVEAEAEDGALRLVLHFDDPQAAMGRLALDAAQAELAQLRALAEDAPGPIWALDAAGSPVWANRAYLALSDLARAPGPPSRAATAEGAGPASRPSPAPSPWPATSVFEPPAGLGEGQVETRRLSLVLPGKPELEWFDVTSVRRGAGTVHFATDVGRLVGAEASRSSFVQTLSKAFAHLAIGLAVFDRQRRLVLFNPAFSDLTGLSFSFLSARPLVHTVLDRLRESQVLPEPRNYATWRDRVAALEAAATSGGYCETWTLPDGRTYRVSGRPHPDGALAFLVEDITDEIALARRVHAELDAARAVLDGLSEAVAVFTPAGTLSLCNAAYDRLWHDDAGTSAGPAGASGGPTSEPGLVGLTDRGLWDEMARWERALGPSSLWEDLRAGRAQRVGAGARVEFVGPDLAALERSGVDVARPPVDAPEARPASPRPDAMEPTGARILAARATPLPGGGLSMGFSWRAAPDEKLNDGLRGARSDAARAEATAPTTVPAAALLKAPAPTPAAPQASRSRAAR